MTQTFLCSTFSDPKTLCSGSKVWWSIRPFIAFEVSATFMDQSLTGVVQRGSIDFSQATQASGY